MNFRAGRPEQAQPLSEPMLAKADCSLDLDRPLRLIVPKRRVRVCRGRYRESSGQLHAMPCHACLPPSPLGLLNRPQAPQLRDGHNIDRNPHRFTSTLFHAAKALKPNGRAEAAVFPIR